MNRVPPMTRIRMSSSNHRCSERKPNMFPLGAGGGPRVTSGRDRLLGDELDEVAAGVIEDSDYRCPDVGRWLAEGDALAGQSLVLGCDVVDGELDRRDAVFGECCAIGLHCRMDGRFQQQLGSTWGVRRDDGEPGVLAKGNVMVLGQAQDVGVERERRWLVVNVDAGQLDPHGASFRVVGHRVVMASSGSGLKKWSLVRPRRSVATRPASSRTFMCWEIAWRVEPTRWFMVSAVQISNRLWPFLVASSSRMRRLVSSSSALYTSVTHEAYASGCLPIRGGRRSNFQRLRCVFVDWRSGAQAGKDAGLVNAGARHPAASQVLGCGS